MSSPILFNFHRYLHWEERGKQGRIKNREVVVRRLVKSGLPILVFPFPIYMPPSPLLQIPLCVPLYAFLLIILMKKKKEGKKAEGGGIEEQQVHQ